MQKEEWKDILGYEGLYQVSSFGRIKSLGRSYHGGVNGRSLLTKREKILIPQIKNGYANVNLYNSERKMSTKTIHRLVANEFINNLENKPQVNHIDYDRKNNAVHNLEWCSAKENSLHSFNNYIEHSLSNLKEINDGGENKKPILQMTKDGSVVKEYSSMSEASISMCGKVTSTIVNHIKDTKSRRTAYGYVWVYKTL